MGGRRCLDSLGLTQKGELFTTDRLVYVTFFHKPSQSVGRTDGRAHAARFSWDRSPPSLAGRVNREATRMQSYV